jgi:hypothetical protein
MDIEETNEGEPNLPPKDPGILAVEQFLTAEFLDELLGEPDTGKLTQDLPKRERTRDLPAEKTA